MSRIGNGTEFIIGEVFFQQFVTVYDNDNSKIGFAPTLSSIYDNIITDRPEGDPIIPVPAPDPIPVTTTVPNTPAKPSTSYNDPNDSIII
jgi:hypothetical protein